jgi:hypothetical protein
VSKVVIVHLRQPFRSDPSEKRSDPFWEFGSFGITTCHANNLMKPGNSKRLKNVRLAFAQGGKGEMKLVFLSPPISKVVEYEDRSEVLWERRAPFKFCKAPLLIDNDGNSDFPMLVKSMLSARRTTWLGRFSSKFRSRTAYLEAALGKEIIAVFDAAYEAASREDLAMSYVEALPYTPPLIDAEREKTYEDGVKQAIGQHRGCIRRHSRDSGNPPKLGRLANGCAGTERKKER